MPRYSYTADGADGVPSEGTLEADSFADAAAQLEALGITPRSLRETTEQETTASPLPEPATSAEAIDRLLAARDHLAPALAAYASESPRGKQRRRMTRLARIYAGDPAGIRAAVAESPREWAPLLAAAANDSPGEALAQFFQHDGRTRQGRQRLSLAAMYPLFLVTLVTLIAWGFATFLIPAFREIFVEFGLELPALTLFVLSASAFLERGGAALLVTIAALATLGFRLWPRWAPSWLRDWAERLGGWLPMKPATASRVARETAVLIESGASAEQAFAEAQPPSVPTPRPALAFALSEQTPDAARPHVLRQLDLCYAEHTAGRASWRHALVGPVAVIAIGAIVGLTIVALFLPLVRLVEGLIG